MTLTTLGLGVAAFYAVCWTLDWLRDDGDVDMDTGSNIGNPLVQARAGAPTAPPQAAGSPPAPGA